MDRIITEGTARNMVRLPDSNAPDPTERKFVTYVNSVGAVHTVIVDIEHAAQDGEQLLKWFRQTITEVEHGGHANATQVLDAASDVTGIEHAPAGEPESSTDAASQEARF